MKTTTRLFTAALVGTVLSFGLQPNVQAQTTLNYTNLVDTWLTPASWSPANNWTSGTVKTNATTANVRLNIGTNINQAVAVTYDATMGTTILNNAGVATRGFAIGSGSGTTGAVTVVGGTLALLNGTTSDSCLIGSPAGLAAGSGTLTLAGGNFVFTNASGNGFGVMAVPFRGGSTNGAVVTNYAQGTLTVGSGSTATVDRVFFGFTASEAGAFCSGTINLNAGGTLNTRNIRGRDSDAHQMTAALNLNGGTLRVFGPNSADLTAAFISEVANSTNFTVNVQSGGAVVDTAGFNATIAKRLLDAGGGGGLTKNGAGTLTLSQTNTYTGPTEVNAGSLAFNLPMSSSALILADGTTATITSGNTAWTNSTTSLTNATINLALGAVTTVPSAATAVLKTSALNVSGSNVIHITSASGLPLGTVKLIDYTTSGNRTGSGTFHLGTVPPGVVATLVDGPNDVSLNVTLAVRSLIWTASVNNEWNTSGVLNWDSGANAYSEAYPGGIGDVVNFTDAAGAFYTVNLTGAVKPADVVISHTTASAVTLSGVGEVTGANGITKTGNGTTLLSVSNTFTGVAAVNNGILQVDNPGALGSTNGATVVTGTGTVLIGDGFGDGTTVTGETISLNGAGFGGVLGQLRGAIDSTANVWAGPIVLAGNNGRIGTEINGNITIAGPISDGGSNYFVLYRPGNGGTITVSNAAHTIGGSATFMTAGTGASVKLGVADGFSTNVLQVGPGVTDLNGFNQTISGLDQFSSPGVLLNNGGSPSTLTINVPGTNTHFGSCSIQDGASTISLVKLGIGRQTLNNTNASTFTGPTSVNEGELRVNGVLANTAITVASGATLGGFGGLVASNITVNSGGTLAPGSGALGVLTNTSTVTLNAGSFSLFHLDATNSLSDLLVASSLTYGGTLVVTNLGTTPLTNGQVFQLVSATTPSGTFANAASVAIQPAGTGTFDALTGQLTVTATGAPTIPTTPTNITFTATSSEITISWPTNYLGWSLQAQTNARSVGLKTDTNLWFTIPGTESVTATNLPVDKLNGTVFFRLFYAAP